MEWFGNIWNEIKALNGLAKLYFYLLVFLVSFFGWTIYYDSNRRRR